MGKINFSNACNYGHDNSRSTCMSDSTAQKILALKNNIKLDKPIETILQEKGKTIDELGLLLDKRVISVIGVQVVMKELNENFKPVGPTDWSLFNNFVEDNVMRHLSRWDNTFLGLDVNLMDFETYGGSLTKLKFSDDGINYNGKSYKTFGCVLNTMKMSGDLSRVGHWVALFGDFRNPQAKTIEYFNSSGRSAPPELWSWMQKVSSKLANCTPLNVSNIQHQKSETECGIYSVYFITARVCGICYKKFRETTISDERVNKFRKNMFNDQNAIEDKSLLEQTRLI